jgi:ribosome-associated protein
MTEKRASTSRRSGSSAKARKPVAAKRAAATSKAPVKKKAPARAAKPAARSVAKLPTAKGAVKRPKTAAPPASGVVKVIELALDDMKAVQVKILDVRKLTDIADTLVIASGNSDRHVRSIADKVVEQAKKAGFRPMGVEGQRDGEWVLVDLQDAIVHIMLPRVRELYRLEDLWDVSAARRDAAVGE